MNVETLHDMDGQIMYKVTSPKFKHPFEVSKSRDSFVFYHIKTERGVLAKALQSKFTSPKLALAALKEYIRTTKETQIAARDRKYKENHASKLQSDDKEHVQ